MKNLKAKKYGEQTMGEKEMIFREDKRLANDILIEKDKLKKTFFFLVFVGESIKNFFIFCWKSKLLVKQVPRNLLQKLL